MAINRSKNKLSFSTRVRGGIIPHHLLVSDVIADFFSRLSTQKPTTIILVGPNHYERGNFEALTSLYDWETPLGIVHADESIIGALIGSQLVVVDEKTLPDDHSLSAIMPFIKYYLPDAKVVPILVSRSLSKEESEILATKLSSLFNDNTVVVASVDFSHYLSSTEARDKDEITLQILKEFDYQRLYLLDNDYLDSPASVGILLMTMQKLGSTNMEILFHTNSGEILNNKFIPTTSYFEIVYY